MSKMSKLSVEECKESEELIKVAGWAMIKNHTFVVEGAMKTLYNKFADVADDMMTPLFAGQYAPLYTIRNLLDQDRLERFTAIAIYREFENLEDSCQSRSGKTQNEWNAIRFKIFLIVGASMLEEKLELETSPASATDISNNLPVSFDTNGYRAAVDTLLEQVCKKFEEIETVKELADTAKQKLIDFIGGTAIKPKMNSEKIFSLLTAVNATKREVSQFIDEVDKVCFTQIPYLAIMDGDRFNGENKIQSIVKPNWSEDKNRSNGPYTSTNASASSIPSSHSTSINYQKEFPASDPLHKVVSSPSVNKSQANSENRANGKNSSNSISNSSPKPSNGNHSSSTSHASRDESPDSPPEVGRHTKASRSLVESSSDEGSTFGSAKKARPAAESKSKSESNKSTAPAETQFLIGSIKDLMNQVEERPKLVFPPLRRETADPDADASTSPDHNDLVPEKIQRESGRRMKWSIVEEEAFIAGVRKHGTGNWAIMLADPEFRSRLINRNSVNLKDKFRTMQKLGVIFD